MTYTIQQAHEGTPMVLVDFTQPSRVQQFAQETLGEGLKYADVFFYLYRRFGPTTCSTNPVREQSRYLLTTPHPEVFLCVSVLPEACSCLMFQTVITKRLHRKLHPRHLPQGHPLLHDIQQALRATLAQLNEPVEFKDVRHTLKGPLGEVHGCSVAHPPHPAITYGIPHHWLTGGPTLEELER